MTYPKTALKTAPKTAPKTAARSAPVLHSRFLRSTWLAVTAVLLLVSCLAGCRADQPATNPANSPANSPAARPERTPIGLQKPATLPPPSPTPQPFATSTEPPSPTSSYTPTSSPTQPPAAPPTDTPLPPTATTLPGPAPAISSDNAGLLQALRVWGRGVSQEIVPTAGGQVVLVRTPFGLYLYRAGAMDLIAFLEDVDGYRFVPGIDQVLTTYAGQGEVKIWDLLEGNLVATLTHTANPPRYPPAEFSLEAFLSVRALQFSPDNRRLAISYGDDQIEIWQTAGWQHEILLTSNIAPAAQYMSFSPNGAYLATTDGSTGTLAIWQLGDGKLLRRVPNVGRISANPFSPDYTKFVTAGYAAIQVYSFPGFDLLHLYKIPDESAEVVFTPDGQHLIVDEVQVRRVADGSRLRLDKEQAVLHPPSTTPTTQNAAPTPDLAPVDPAVVEAQGHYTGLQAVVLQPDGALLAWGTDNTTFYAWELLNDQVTHTLLAEPPANRAVLAPDSSQFAVCLPKALNLLNRTDGSLSSSDRCKRYGALAYSPDGLTLARGSSLLVDLIDPANGQIRNNLRGHTNEITALAFAPNGRYLASGTMVTRAGAELFLWKLNPLSIWQRWKITSAVNYNDSWIGNLLFSPDSELLVVGGVDQHVKLYRVHDGWQLRIMKVDTAAQSLAFSPDGRLLAAGDKDGKVFIWSIPDGELLAKLSGHRGAVNSINFVAGGSALLTASADGTVRLWGLPAE